MPHNPPIFDFENWQPRFHYELVAAERLGWLTPDRVPFHLAVSEYYRLQFLTIRRITGQDSITGQESHRRIDLSEWKGWQLMIHQNRTW